MGTISRLITASALAIDADDGRMFATLFGSDGAIAMIGSCAPL